MRYPLSTIRFVAVVLLSGAAGLAGVVVLIAAGGAMLS